MIPPTGIHPSSPPEKKQKNQNKQIRKNLPTAQWPLRSSGVFLRQGSIPPKTERKTQKTNKGVLSFIVYMFLIFCVFGGAGVKWARGPEKLDGWSSPKLQSPGHQASPRAPKLRPTGLLPHPQQKTTNTYRTKKNKGPGIPPTGLHPSSPPKESTRIKIKNKKKTSHRTTAPKVQWGFLRQGLIPQKPPQKRKNKQRCLSFVVVFELFRVFGGLGGEVGEGAWETGCLEFPQAPDPRAPGFPQSPKA